MTQKFFSPTGALAQLVARRSHNPKVVSSILTGPILNQEWNSGNKTVITTR